MAARGTHTKTTTYVRHVAKQTRDRRNGPHLGDLREFVEAAEGLPDDVPVHIRQGYLTESGRRDVEFEIRYEHPTPTTGEESTDA